MNVVHHSAIAILLTITMPANSSAAIDVSSWLLSASVMNSANSQDVIVGFNQVMNPFQGTHTAMLGISYASGTYDFAWSAAGGSLNIAASDGAAGNPVHLAARTSGNIILTTTLPYRLDVDAVYNFHLLGGDRQALLSLLIGDSTAQQMIYNATYISAPITGNPAIGSFTIQRSFDLQEGHLYGLNYEMSVDSFSGSASVLATGDGYINFTFTRIPEPGSAALLALGLPWFLRRR